MIVCRGPCAGDFSEHYERRLERSIAEFRARDDFMQEIHDLMCKTTFRSHFIKGLRDIGCLELTEKLE